MSAAGAVGAEVADQRSDALDETRDELVAAGEQLMQLHGELNDTTRQLTAADDERAQLQADADDVAARESTVEEQEAELREQEAALTKREQELAAREASVQRREEALESHDVGHPLLDSISDDGAWVVGRDIKPGTWEAFADDTGCEWQTSDGRAGSGDGSYDMMEVRLEVGQTFTIHGCSLWSNYDDLW